MVNQKTRTDLVVRDPKIAGGVPILRGTRITVGDIAAQLQFATIDHIASGYRWVDRELIDAAVEYYAVHRDEIDRQIAEDDAFANDPE